MTKIYGHEISKNTAEEIVEKVGISKFSNDWLLEGFRECINNINYAYELRKQHDINNELLYSAPIAYEVYKRFYLGMEIKNVSIQTEYNTDQLLFWTHPVAIDILYSMLIKDGYFILKSGHYVVNVEDIDMAPPKGHEAYNTEGQGGRPIKYTPEKIEGFADELIEWLKDPMNIWFKDFCLDRNINPDLMSEWANNNEKFSEAHQLAKHRQESRLINGGLLNAYNASVVKLVLSNAHGWTDKQETKLSGDAGNPLAFILQNIDGTTKELVNESESE